MTACLPLNCLWATTMPNGTPARVANTVEQNATRIETDTADRKSLSNATISLIGAGHDIVGIRPGEKLHEQMIAPEDALYTYEYAEHYKILPAIHGWSQDPQRINGGKLVAPDFTYCSDNNTEWMSIDTLRTWIEQNHEKIGRI